jgi:aminoglycoside phosphotransferase (APT) family kinase protein
VSSSPDPAAPSSPSSQGAEPHIVGPYLAKHLGDPAWKDCSVGLISGGKSNLTYVVSSAAGDVVLRRPPLSTVLATAHDMGREYTVMTALRDTAVPVPVTRLLCTDESVLGAPFYVMDRVEGHVIRGEMPPGYAESAAERERMSRALIAVLAEIHKVEIAGRLDGFGRPEGYLERQLRRWVRQWEASKDAELPALDALAAELSESRPEQSASTLVHGDYRLDNTIMSPTDPGRVAAVLDWELSTLGDPLADVGLLVVYWGSPGQDVTGGMIRRVTSGPGFPTVSDAVEMYAQASGRDLSALPWYVAFASYKLAVISAGIAARARAGAMIGEGFDTAGAAVLPLVEAGRETLRRGTL